jgi:hypothetical protein
MITCVQIQWIPALPTAEYLLALAKNIEYVRPLIEPIQSKPNVVQYSEVNSK